MKKKHISLAIGLAVSVFFLWYAFKDVNFHELWASIRQADWRWGLVTVIVTMASFYWRSLRWRIFLLPVKVISSSRLFGPLMIGFGFNNIFPARAGEFARPLALMKQEKVPYGTGFSTVILERLVDVVTLLALLVTMPLYITLDPTLSFAFSEDISISAGWIQDKMPLMSIAALVLLTGVLSFLFPPIERLYIRILHALPVLSSGIKLKLEGFIKSFANGFQSLKSVRALSMTVVHSIIIWFSIAFTFQLMSWGYPGIDMSFGQALGFLVVTCIVITIPSSPGFWGLYEFGGMVALVLMGIVPNTTGGQATALGFTMVVHLLQWVPTTAFGLWYAAKLSISASDAESASEKAPEVLEEVAKQP